jgi:hypothetical protein
MSARTRGVTAHQHRIRSRTGSFATFERRFKPIEREDGESLLWDIHERRPGDDYRHWWTVIDCDGRLYLTPGFRFVDRFAYVRCAVAWTDDEEQQPGYLYSA